MWVTTRMLILEMRGREAVAAGEQALRSSLGHLINTPAVPVASCLEPRRAWGKAESFSLLSDGN